MFITWNINNVKRGCRVCISRFLLVKHILQLPFGQTNDALHKKKSAFTLDFLIPSATYIDDKMTIGEIIKVRADSMWATTV